MSILAVNIRIFASHAPAKITTFAASKNIVA